MARLQIATPGFRLTSTRFAACDLMANLGAGENVGSIPTVLYPYTYVSPDINELSNVSDVSEF